MLTGSPLCPCCTGAQLRRAAATGDSPDDVLQVAALGLVKAIERFDTEREIAFTSYAVPTILGEIKRYFRDCTWAMRMPRDLQELALRVDRAIATLADELRRQPSVGEVAPAVGGPEGSVLEAMQAGDACRAISFDAPRRHDDDAIATLGDAVGVSQMQVSRVIRRALDRLRRLAEGPPRAAHADPATR